MCFWLSAFSKSGAAKFLCSCIVPCAMAVAPMEHPYHPGMAAYDDLMAQYEDLKPSLQSLERMLFEMYDAGVAKEKHDEFHKTSPLMRYACGNWFAVSTLRLLFPRFCTENGISNLHTGGKYLEGFVQWLPDHLKKIKLDQALNAEDLAEALMKINFGLCTFLTKSRNAGLTVPSQVLSQWHQLSALAEEIAEIDDAQYRQLLGLPANLLAPEAFLETPN